MAMQQTYLDLLAQAGIPPNDPRVAQLQEVMRRTPHTPQVTKAFDQLFPGLRPDKFHIGAGGSVTRDTTNKDVAIKTALSFAVPTAAYLLAPGATAATGGSGAAPAISTPAPIAPSALPGAHAATTVGAFAPTAAKAGGWGNAIRELIPLGLQVGANLGSQAINSSGIDKAVAEQKAATEAAQQRIDAAQRTAGDVYNQQRSDYQTVANVPMQALGNALGIPIGDIGPVSFTGGQTLGQMAQIDTPMKGTWEQPITTPFPLATGAQGGQTLGQMAQPAQTAPVESPQQRAQAQSQSGYVRFRSPDGRDGTVPRAMMRQAIEQGGTPLEA